MLHVNDTCLFNVGGGIVADSDPEMEYEETLHKGKGIMQALGITDNR
jgi:anthranilate/para-aminobenzoate synthase component I